MKLKLSSTEDFWAGVMFIAFGAVALYIARDYPMGSAMRMGPGYFPTAIGLCLLAIGGAIAMTGFRTQGEGIGRFPWRAILLLGIGFASFAWGIEKLGFIPSLAILIALTSFAGREYRWKEVLMLMVLMIAGCWAVFIYALGLPYPLLWER